MIKEKQIFEQSASSRLKDFLVTKRGDDFGEVKPITPDASTREYFRIKWERSTAIACVYQESFSPETQPYIDITNLFAASGLPVAEIIDFDGERGVIIHQDFGDKILRDVVETVSTDESEVLLHQTITLIAEVQKATLKAFELGSIASRLAFDFDKLSWELDFFTKHYFESLRSENLSESDFHNLKKELDEVATELAARPRILTHRDFHAANLMLDQTGRICIIDQQDARMGTSSYDLVSLLLDRVEEPPPTSWIREKRLFFLEERRKLGLPPIDPDEFAHEFRLQTIQRCLKAIGTFSFQTAVRGKNQYAQYINPMFEIVLHATEWLNRFPHLQTIIKKQLT